MVNPYSDTTSEAYHNFQDNQNIAAQEFVEKASDEEKVDAYKSSTTSENVASMIMADALVAKTFDTNKCQSGSTRPECYSDTSSQAIDALCSQNSKRCARDLMTLSIEGGNDALKDKALDTFMTKH